MTHPPHASFMQEALALADRAAEIGEVPIGAVLVVDDVVVGRGHNQPLGAHDPTAHAEIVAIREAAAALGNYRLGGATLYVTVEPCLMCIGALVHARVETLVYGVAEPKTGAVESAQHALDHPSLNHRVRVVSGVLAADCRARLRRFFQERR
jgi:tRNA(adenine34) deaminase